MKCLWILSLGCVVFSAVGSIACLFQWSSGITNSSSFSSEFPKPHPFVWEKIGYGPLGLCGLKDPHPLRVLNKEFVLLGLNTRPDENSADQAILLGIKSSQAEKMVYSGEKIYLSEGENGLFTFSQKPTSLELGLTVISPEAVQIDVFSHGVKTNRFTVNKASFQNREEAPYASCLKEGRCWGQDVFLQAYGGEEFNALSQKVKIELGSQILFVSAGDILEWNKDRWEPNLMDHGPQLEKKPLAYVKSVGTEGAELEVWDAEGFASETYLLRHESLPKPAYKVEDLFAAIKPRALTEVSCLLGKRRVILKEGDWWLKTAQGWKNLRRERDIEAYLAHQLEGELFIFESIQSEKGKTVLKGQRFDAMRSAMEPLALTVQADKKVNSLARGRKKEGSGGAGHSSMAAKAEFKKQPVQQMQQSADTTELKR